MSVSSDRLPCPDCGARRGLSVSNGWAHCFACGRNTKLEAKNTSKKKAPGKLLTGLMFQDLTKRRLTEETCRYWGYGVTKIGNTPVQVAQYRDEAGAVVAQKIRGPDKDFSWRGDHSKAGLFGQHLWRNGGKMVIVTEGEIDAMSVSQVQRHQWPVVSVPDGAHSAAKAILKALDWLEQFERVVLMFDMDEPGRKAAVECAMLLSPGKAYIASLPLKDANEMLQAGRGAELIDAAWGAKMFRPDGIVCGKDIWERVVDTKTFEAVPYPWTKLNTITRGCRRGELVTVIAGTGIGKSEFVRQVVASFHDHHGEMIGYISLEESIQRTALGFMGLHLGRRLHVDPGDLSHPDVRRAFDATIGSGRYFLYDHWGSQEGDHLLNRIRYMVRALGCSTIVLDHISIVVSGLDTDDERRTIDVLMTKLRSMVEELQFRLIVVSHVRRVSGDKTPEEGGQLTLQHIRNTTQVAALSNIVIGLERDQQSETRKNWTRVRILKNRFTGETGPAGWLHYDPETGRLTEGEPSPEEAELAEEYGL